MATKRIKRKPKVRNTDLNMYPVAKASDNVHALYERVREKGISMRKLCELAGVHHDVAGRWRRGETWPTERTLTRLYEALRSDEATVAAQEAAALREKMEAVAA